MSSQATLTTEQAEEYAKCAQDPWYFVKYIHISDPNRGDLIFEAWPHLHRLLNVVRFEDRIIILKARQIGITWLIAVYALWLCLFRPNSRVLVVSEDQIKSTEFKWRCRYMYDRLPEWLHIRDERLDKDNDQLLEFSAMDSSIHSLPAVKSAGRSFTASLVVLDEWAFQEYGRDIYTAILPTIEHGKLIGISTANGKNNVFYSIWERAKNKLNRFLPIFIPYFVKPGRDEQWWKDTAANMDSIDEAMREYPKDEAEAFTVSAEAYFNKEALNHMAVKDGNPWGNYSSIWFGPDPERQYAAGIDPAPGGGDPSVCHILDDAGKQVAHLSTNEDIDLFSREAFKLLHHYGFPNIVIERQGEGNTVIRNFRKGYEVNGKHVSYPEHKMYHSTENQIGWYTTKNNRADILAELRAAVRERKITLLSEQTVVEFKGFGYDKDGKLQGIYGHDDEVMAMALAWFQFASLPPPLDTDDWAPKDYVRQEKTDDLRRLNWAKKNPLQCYARIEQEGKPPRRCGINHRTVEDLQNCPHQ